VSDDEQIKCLLAMTDQVERLRTDINNLETVLAIIRAPRYAVIAQAGTIDCPFNRDDPVEPDPLPKTAVKTRAQ
jgi:hypothetical protein